MKLNPKNHIYRNQEGYLVMKYGKIEMLVCPRCIRVMLDEDVHDDESLTAIPVFETSIDPEDVLCMECAREMEDAHEQ